MEQSASWEEDSTPVLLHPVAVILPTKVGGPGSRGFRQGMTLQPQLGNGEKEDTCYSAPFRHFFPFFSLCFCFVVVVVVCLFIWR